MLRQDQFDLDRRHILAGHLEHLAVAAVEVVTAAGVAASAIASEKPTAAKRLLGHLGHVEVAIEDRDATFTAHDDLALLAWRYRPAVAVLHVDLAMGGHIPHRRRQRMRRLVAEHR